MRYLGIDYGTKKIGLALSDEAGTMGFPHEVVPNDPLLLPFLSTLISTEGITRVVIGESFNSDGNDNPVAKEARAFGAHLSEATGVPVDYEMEALTTQEARRDMEGNRTNHGNVDASAAALILTSYLSRTHDHD